ncbi:MAG TPA: hypothetical protein VLT33_34300 [Labilithrix sp.]|nr:hypothetical protein [Labilithrix sp.]
MTTSLLDAFDLVAHSEQLLPRLEAAGAELATRPGLAEEKQWLAIARQRVAAAREGIGDLLVRALRLPEIEPLKGEHARVLQGAAVDALERLHAGITFAGTSRSPLLEALYWKLKLPVLRRCQREEFEKFCGDFETRLGSSYARRMLATPDYQVVMPAVHELRRTFAVWRSVFTSEPLTDAEAEPLRDELEAVARRLETPCRQARLLAQAALVPLRDVLDGAALIQKPRKRGPRDGDEDTHPVLERPPPDPAEPSPEELAEIAATHSATASATS